MVVALKDQDWTALLSIPKIPVLRKSQDIKNSGSFLKFTNKDVFINPH